MNFNVTNKKFIGLSLLSEFELRDILRSGGDEVSPPETLYSCM